MSFSFDARFPVCKLSLPEVIQRLDTIFADSDILYDGQIVRLHSRGGVPTVMSLESDGVENLADVAEHAAGWWGVSLYCISSPLARALGRTDAMEVYVRLFKAPDGGVQVEYNESSAAFRARRESSDLASDLIAFLARFAEALEVDFVIYGEEGDTVVPPRAPEINQVLQQQAQSRRAVERLLIVSQNIISLDDARRLAGSWARNVGLMTSGFVVANFLAGEPSGS